LALPIVYWRGTSLLFLESMANSGTVTVYAALRFIGQSFLHFSSP
jgi:hypothetical protein